MSRARRILFAFLMAFAVVVGQQAVAMHDLAHATGHKQESTPGKTTCDKCFACAELSSAVGTSIPAVVLPDAVPVARDEHSEAAVCTAPRLAFRSRAPPKLS
ncbi:MAG TPA: hypothetical protein VLH12_12580 [Usitatibacter sp.]|nr:hypothetical protein [Usitatibacter sp.]